MEKISKRDLNLLFSLLGLLPIKDRPNALYSKKDVLKPVVRATVQNTSVENAAKWVNCISADSVFYRLNSLSVKDVRLWFNQTLDRLSRKARKKYRLVQRVRIAIDYTKIPYYGKKDGIWVIHSRHEKGTSKFLVVISMCIVVKGQRFTIGILPVSVFDSSADLVEKMLEAAGKHFSIEKVLLDRGFEGIDVINMLKGHGYRFIMPKRRNKRTVKFIETMHLQGREREQFTIREGNRYASFDLVVLETDQDLVGFITNTKGSPERIGELYRTRWGIETGYSVKNEFHAVTCSNNFAVRYLLVFLSFLIYNLWVFVNIAWHRKGIYKITAKDLCVYIASILDQGVP